MIHSLQLGVPRGTTHTLRHCYCSFLANAKVPAFQVMKLMGHTSLDIVLTYYHISEAELMDSVKSLSFEQMLAGTATSSLTTAASTPTNTTATTPAEAIPGKTVTRGTSIGGTASTTPAISARKEGTENS